MIYLALGSNQGPRRHNLRQAIFKLGQNGIKALRCSPAIETPAMLDANAKPEWIRPYLNCAIECECELQPRQALDIIRRLEAEMGRTPAPKWSPRPIDVDILIWHDRQIEEPDLRIPHIGIAERSFVLTPLLDLAPELVVPGIEQSIFQLSKRVSIDPLWMGILNITPDSFSGDGLHGKLDNLESSLEHCFEHGIQIVDLGAMSTRPNAHPIEHREEWKRLAPALDLYLEKSQDDALRPRISIDSNHWQTVSKAVDLGIDYINDVGGLADPEMCAIVKDSGCQAIAMHSLSVPADPEQKLPMGDSAVAHVEAWLERRLDNWLKQGLDPAKIIIDPGIGFGKDALQSLELLSACRKLRDYGLRLLIGHSRKSFMQGFSEGAANRDLETLGISLALSGNVDILRVHDPVTHKRACLAYRHVRICS